MSSVETGQMSAVETGQMTAAETSVLSQQKTSVLSQQKTSVLSQQQTSAAAEAALRPWRGPRQKLSKPLSFCVFELATPYSAAEWRRSVSL